MNSIYKIFNRQKNFPLLNQENFNSKIQELKSLLDGE